MSRSDSIARLAMVISEVAGGGCQPFQKYRMPRGYGMTWFESRRVLAHRAAYCKANGVALSDIKGLAVRHRCDNPPCINPRHLLLGTKKQNSEDMVERGRSAFGEKNGQAFLDEGVILDIKRNCIPRSKTAGCKVFAEKYNISYQHVWDIVKGNRWKHIEASR